MYECHTPSTDERYFGSYSAKTTVVGKEITVFMWLVFYLSVVVSLSC